MMQQMPVIEKIQTLPKPLLREVEDFVDFLLTRYSIEKTAAKEEYPAHLMTRINAAGGAFDWLNDPAEDIYSDDDGEAV
jgi:hypothetical protein